MVRITDDILYRVEKPSRYVGGELNEVIKDPKEVDIRFGFCFPDVYEVGMSHLGSRILYHVLNQRKDTYCERVYAPWPDMEKLMRENNIPLYALETKDPINEFNFLAFTLQYEMSYTNILNMLNMGGIPLRASERTEKDPLVIAGGPCAYNPEPLYDIVDIFQLGEGEEGLNDLLDLYQKHKDNFNKEAYLREASHIPSVYIPSLYDVTYNEDGTIKEFIPKYDDVPKKVKKRIINNFDQVDFPESLIVPYSEIVHDRVVLELFRGCTNGCRFCQAGMIYRPVREKSRKTLLDQARKMLKATGYDEVSLVSLSTCDYSDIQGLVKDLIEEHGKNNVSVALPSIRVDAFSVDLLKEIQKVRKTGLTFAPEAGSQRMRDVINKGLSEERILEAAKNAFESGWSTIKLYFILGVPYETVEDAAEIGLLAEKIADQYFAVPKHIRNKGLRITVSTSILVPKPFTPFQWAPMEKMDIVTEKINAVKGAIKSRSIVYNYHEQKTSYMEAVLARGDRRLCDVLIKAYEKGAKFDGWSEYFDFELWQEALAECNVDGDFYVYRQRSYDEILPWDFIDIGVTRKYLERENEKAKTGEPTQNCRKGCTGCGVNINFKDGECFEGAILN
ncbi:MAG: TIGR03960 family B12-binding radical SAM protein [Clostridium perfringens]|uniref:TIGR03960 family B12-binding radical SAM protein n=1 Tax=Clostridium perfringens TaxID=1502 RepID=UPI001DAB47E7|nr:TIGR03960 family B12-binding radical SAM protein [Clostridium perfringens]EHK2279372.1 TIGR03960 family B12-binding radical SAM protein [Clostridium perfringens]EJT6494333.1 TIGR03960 family B12-binding radical SAM protein [Clostridium perfringens]ELC8403026.1 TIGR03960 family B12-binding radical SAM protein [Clostridium perfringens]MDM0626425.1 TIGR03960 family B12-binding radical SAM protein [Clostridium perfringens]MDU5775133.1 TIGR03960 family B12-binding radical SAM protein [Clostridiu